MQLVAGKAVFCKWRLATSLLFAALCMSQAVIARAQESTETAQLCVDSETAAPAGDDASAPRALVPTAREATLHTLPRNILQDQKDLWLFPVKLGEGHHWLPAALIVGATAGFIATDPQTMPHFRETSAFSGFNSVFSGTTRNHRRCSRHVLCGQPDSQELVRPEFGAVSRGSRRG
jgi:hypothetical protein